MAALLNLSEAEFEVTTPGYMADLYEMYELKAEREIKLAEYANREHWERARMLVWYQVQLQIEKKDRQSIKKFMPLPWDEPDNVDVEKMRELARSAKWITANLEPEPERDYTPEEVEDSINNLLREWQQ